MAKRKAPVNAFPGLTKPKTARKGSGKRRGRVTVSPATFIARSRAVSAEQKAMYHNVLGAGRRGVLRKFFDLNVSDQNALRDGLEKLVGQRIRKAGA